MQQRLQVMSVVGIALHDSAVLRAVDKSWIWPDNRS
jgi:hypothetical protein